MEKRHSLRRPAIASLIGTTLEYYDFAVYNTSAALVFNRIFFPSFDPVSGTILAFSTFAVGYLARPLGGVVFGHLGDKRGRRFVLITTMILMGATTGMIGTLPTYAAAGILSPVVLIMLRFVQGVALGGEWAGAVLLSMEHGMENQRGRNASWAQAGPSLGTLLATGFMALVTLPISPQQFQSWGWRITFLASLALVCFGLWVRSNVDETPLFKSLDQRHSTVKAPVGHVLRLYWRRLLIAGGARVGADVLYSLLIVFTLTYLTEILHLSRALALTAVSIGGLFNVLCVPVFGALSDRLGRRPVYGIGMVMGIAWTFIFFRLLDSLNPTLIVLAIVTGFVIHAVMYGPQGAFITEQFPTRVRYAGSSLAYTLAGIAGGGFAPMMFAALWRAQGTTAAISFYLIGALSITGIALVMARETSHLPLEE